MLNISWKDLLRLTLSLTLVALFSFGGAILLTEFGLVQYASPAATLAGILATAITFSPLMRRSNQSSTHSRTNHSIETNSTIGSQPAQLSMKERVQRMRTDDSYHSYRRRSRSSTLRRILRWIISTTPITIYMTELAFYGLGVIGVLILVPYSLRFFTYFVDIHTWLVIISELPPMNTTAFEEILLVFMSLVLIFCSVYYYAT